MVMIYALGAVSGGKFNPAVSVALAIAGTRRSETKSWMEPEWIETWTLAGIESAIQITAGVAAGLTYGLAMWDVFNLAPTPGFSLLQAGMAELIYTFMLCFVVLNVATSKDNTKEKPNQYFGLAIGFVVIAGGYGAGHISGGCFNPAVALGIDVSSAGIGFGWSIVYCGFEFAGAILAALLFGVVRAHEKEEGNQPAGLPAKLLSEFLGTFILVLTVGLNVLGGSKAPVFSIACSLMCMVYALGSVSGANFNPAVSLCLVLTNRADVLKPADACMYMLVQFAGGITAGFTYMWMERGRTFPLAPGKGYTLAQAAFAEIVFTFLLCYVVCAVATVKNAPYSQYFGLAIGSCVTAGGYAVGSVSGGSLNPAVSFGIAVSHMLNGGGIVNAVAYTIFEFIGGAIAAGLFKFTHSDQFPKTKGDDALNTA